MIELQKHVEGHLTLVTPERTYIRDGGVVAKLDNKKEAKLWLHLFSDMVRWRLLHWLTGSLLFAVDVHVGAFAKRLAQSETVG